ncbi:prephenate dehydrogenase/arogenate dehydrogenase family protein [bacterium]|nr:MAG: prephenate dehydrogenase/arogenate dehydrogenase family protein [bacterium]
MRIAIVGTGLIGASLGLAWRAAGHTVVGVDADPAALAAALARGAFERGVDFEQARDGQALVLAAPLDAVCMLLESLRGGRVPPLVMDVASLQEPTLRAALGLAGFVTTHPMAGREGGGAQSADAGLFRGHPWIYQPGGGEPEATAVRLIGETGAVAVPMDAAVHDRAVALTSHVPQLLALALARSVGRRIEEAGVREAAGPGLQGALRLASARWTMWRPLLEEQRVRDADLLEDVAGELNELARALRERDAGALQSAFEEGSVLRRTIFREVKDMVPGQDSM